MIIDSDNSLIMIFPFPSDTTSFFDFFKIHIAMTHSEHNADSPRRFFMHLRMLEAFWYSLTGTLSSLLFPFSRKTFMPVTRMQWFEVTLVFYSKSVLLNTFVDEDVDIFYL